MKWLIALAIAQILALGFFGLRVLAIDDRTAELTMKVAATADNWPAAVVEDAPRPNPTATSDHLSAGDVRRIIREELAALSDRNLASSNDRTATDPRHASRAADSLHLKSTVQLELQNYLARGNIGEAEMADLQMKIARLPPDDRTEALNALTKAMSSGDLHGQF